MKVGIIGTGYVGLVTGTCLAELGSKVVCVDVDAEKVKKINQGISPIYEPGLEKILKKTKVVATTRMEEISESDIIFICVGTPSNNDGTIDLTYVENASRAIGGAIKNAGKRRRQKQVIVIKSTVLPGTAEKTVIPLIEKSSGKKFKKDFSMAVNPEFLREGSAVYDFFNPDRIVIGTDEKHAFSAVEALYRNFKCEKVKTSLRAAEMIKYASNAFLAAKVTFMNEIGNMCKLLGIDAYEVARGVGLDKRIGESFLNAGIGFGGSCFPKDLKALAAFSKQLKYDPLILNAVLKINDAQPRKLLELLERETRLKGKDIVVFGLSFKPGTDDMRGSPSIRVINYLLEKGAKIHAADPEAIENAKKIFGSRIKYYGKPEEAAKKGDIILILTEWKEFRKKELYRGKIVFDGRRIEEAEKAAQRYEGVCW